VDTARSLSGGSGWVLLTYSRRQRRFWNRIATDYSQAAIDAAPVLALDMYEHAYHMDFGANALPLEDPSDTSLPSLSVEELAAQLAKGEPVQVLDARPRHYISRTVDLMEGAVWRDPDRVDEWIGELAPDRPVAVYCAYGFHVGCGVTKTLRERGFDAPYIRGGVSAWYATGGPRALRPNAAS
jgi:Fe-Mn family superoxide dismutase